MGIMYMDLRNSHIRAVRGLHAAYEANKLMYKGTHGNMVCARTHAHECMQYTAGVQLSNKTRGQNKLGNKAIIRALANRFFNYVLNKCMEGSQAERSHMALN